MDTRQMHMCRITTFGEVDLFMRIFMFLQRIVTFPAIGKDCRVLLNILTYKWNQTISTHVRYALHPNSSKSFRVMNFNSNHYYSLLSSTSTSLTTLFFTANQSFINFDIPFERTSAWPDHSSAHFVKPTPSRLVTIQTKDSLKPQGTSTKFLACYIPNRLEPKSKRFPCSLKYCSSNNRRFMLADSTSKKPCFHMPCLVAVTYWTNKTIRPSKFL